MCNFISEFLRHIYEDILKYIQIYVNILNEIMRNGNKIKLCITYVYINPKEVLKS